MRLLLLLLMLLLQDTIRQQEWKIERLNKDNRALEASNCELRAQLETVKEEKLQVRMEAHLHLPMHCCYMLLKKQRQDRWFPVRFDARNYCTLLVPMLLLLCCCRCQRR
jgi:hypothetical protein